MLPVDGFKLVVTKISSKLKRRYRWRQIFFLVIYIQYPIKLHELHNNLPLLSERIKIEKDEKLVVDLHATSIICYTH